MSRRERADKTDIYGFLRGWVSVLGLVGADEGLAGASFFWVCLGPGGRACRRLGRSTGSGRSSRRDLPLRPIAGRKSIGVLWRQNLGNGRRGRNRPSRGGGSLGRRRSGRRSIGVGESGEPLGHNLRSLLLLVESCGLCAFERFAGGHILLLLR